jgi:hypothetical protein
VGKVNVRAHVTKLLFWHARSAHDNLQHAQATAIAKWGESEQAANPLLRACKGTRQSRTRTNVRNETHILGANVAMHQLQFVQAGQPRRQGFERRHANVRRVAAELGAREKLHERRVEQRALKQQHKQSTKEERTYG